MKIKKYIITALFIFVLGHFFNAWCNEKLDFKIEVIQISEDRIDVQIIIISGEPELTYSIWNKEPWENGKEIDNSGKTYSLEYSFSNLKMKSYFIMVSDKNGLKQVKQIQLKY